MLNLRPKAARDDEPGSHAAHRYGLHPFDFLHPRRVVRGAGASTSTCLRRTAGRRFPGAWWKSGLLRDGSFLCEGIPVARADIRAKLQSLVRDFRTRPGQLVLKAAPDAPVEALVFIVDEVRMQGGEKLLIATPSPTRRAAHDGKGNASPPGIGRGPCSRISRC